MCCSFLALNFDFNIHTFLVLESLDFFIADFDFMFVGCTGRPKSCHQSLFFPKDWYLPTILLKALRKFLFSSIFASNCDFLVPFWHKLSPCSELLSESILQFLFACMVFLLSSGLSINSHLSPFSVSFSTF